MSGIGATDHYPKRVGWSHLNCSHCPISDRSVAIKPSMQSYDSPLEKMATLPSMKLLTIMGALNPQF